MEPTTIPAIATPPDSGGGEDVLTGAFAVGFAVGTAEQWARLTESQWALEVFCIGWSTITVCDDSLTRRYKAE